MPAAGNEYGRNVRPRITEPESERGTSLQPSRRKSTDASNTWYDHLNDLPAPLQAHFERARQREREQTEQDREEAHAMWTGFLAEDKEEDPGKKVLKSIHYESAPPEVQKGLQEARQKDKEWAKFEEFGANGWMWIKHSTSKGEIQTTSVYKSRLVSCGNFEMTEGLRSDSPTADVESETSLLHIPRETFGTCSTNETTTRRFARMPFFL